MKISVIGTRGFPLIEGGVEKHCENLYPLMSNDISLTVYRRKPFVSTDGSYSNIRFVDLPSTKIKGVEAFLHSFLATVHALLCKPDVVHFHNIGPALFCPLLKLRKIAVVLTFHSPNYEHDKWGRFAKGLLRFSEKIALNAADKIIFVNRFQMEKYESKIRAKSVFIPNGVKVPLIPESDYYLHEIGVQKGKYVLSVGRITPEKGFDTLIRAFRKAKPDGYKLVIAGGVKFETAYMDWLKTIGDDKDIIFTGNVFGDSLAQLYANAGLYVLSSNNEGFPIVLLEAMSYGLDVVVTDIPATRLFDLEENDYVAVGNVDQMAEKIRQRLQNVASRKYDLSQYDWKEIANTVATLCEQACLKR
jgi:glycosyltransferase involved in cell wall biosynthesis